MNEKCWTRPFPIAARFLRTGSPIWGRSDGVASSESLSSVINEQLYCRRLDFEFGGYTDVDNGIGNNELFLLLLKYLAS